MGCFESVLSPTTRVIRLSVGQGTPLQGPLQGAADGGSAAAAAAAAGELSFEVVSSGSDDDFTPS